MHKNNKATCSRKVPLPKPQCPKIPCPEENPSKRGNLSSLRCNPIFSAQSQGGVTVAGDILPDPDRARASCCSGMINPGTTAELGLKGPSKDTSHWILSHSQLPDNFTQSFARFASLLWIFGAVFLQSGSCLSDPTA